MEAVSASRSVGHVIPSTIVDEYPLHRVFHIGAGERKGQIGLEETGFVAAIEALALKAQTAERALGGDQLCERIGQLDFAAGAAIQPREMIEHLGLKHITADDAERRGRILRRRFLDDALDPHEPAVIALDIENAVT